MGHLADTAIRRFVRYATLGEMAPRARVIVPDAPRLIFRMDEQTGTGATREKMPTFYSYGMHFPLARFVPAKRGRTALWVINGDIWRGGGWSSTGAHQDATRREIAAVIADARKLGKTVRSIVIPFSALDGAGVEYASIRPREIREDWQETFTNTVWIPRAVLARVLPSREHAEAVSREKDSRGTAVSETETLARSRTYHAERVSKMSGARDTWQVTAEITRETLYVGYDHTVPTQDYGHGMMHGAYVDYHARDGVPRVTLWLGHMHTLTVTENTRTIDGVECVGATFTTRRHWLGDCVFSASVVRERRIRNADGYTDFRTTRKRFTFVSSFDYGEPRPLYFLAALPKWSRAETVDAAIQDLAPSAVHAARAAGLAVLRQGDIFAVPSAMDTATLDKLGATRARLTMWTRNAKPKRGELGYVTAPTAAQWQEFKTRRRELVRAAMRANMARDTRPSTDANYRGRRRELVRAIAFAKTDAVAPSWYETEDAKTAWRDTLVKRAEMALAEFDKRGRAPERATGYASKASVWARHGKCYSRALMAWNTTGEIERAKLIPPRDAQAIRGALAVYGTAHTATEVAILPSGTTYVRGTMRHVPEIAGERRERDHVALPLGDGNTWYLAICNTVPRQ